MSHLLIAGSRLCSATRRPLWCALAAPPSFASRPEAGPGTLQWILWNQASLCFCLSSMESSIVTPPPSTEHCSVLGAVWTNIKQAYGGVYVFSWLNSTMQFLNNKKLLDGFIFCPPWPSWCPPPQAYWGMQLPPEAALRSSFWPWTL